MTPMQTVQETRQARLRILKKKHGKWADLNMALGWEATNARLSQILSGTLRSDRGTPYTMGDETARQIETALGLPTGWMDTPPTYAEMQDKPDPMAMALVLMENMPEDMQRQALRLLDALAQPPALKTGTDQP